MQSTVSAFTGVFGGSVGTVALFSMKPLSRDASIVVFVTSALSGVGSANICEDWKINIKRKE